MGRRQAVRQVQEAGEKPPLRDILDHYGVEYRDLFGWQSIRCPFHPDGTASFRINLEEGGFICKTYSCGKSGGDALEFIKLYEGCDYPTAVKIAENVTGGDYSSVSGAAFEGSRIRRVSSREGFSPRFGNGLPARRRSRSA